jgi:hypothetical protein
MPAKSQGQQEVGAARLFRKTRRQVGWLGINPPSDMVGFRSEKQLEYLPFPKF